MAGIQKRPEEKVYFSFQWLGSIANSLITDSGDLAIDWLPLLYPVAWQRKELPMSSKPCTPSFRMTNSNLPLDIKAAWAAISATRAFACLCQRARPV